MVRTKAKLPGKWKLLILPVLVFLLILKFSSCEKEDPEKNEKEIEVNADTLANRGFGLEISTEESQEDMVYGSPATPSDLPSSYDFRDLMPPVRSQGSQGSCVGFSTGYALKSYHEKVQNGYSYTNSDGSVNNDHVMSPAYIFNQIGNSTCESASLKKAFNLLMDQGVSTWSEMPYTDVSCSTNPTSSAKSNATSHRIKNYQSVSVSNTNSIKGYIYEDRPVVFGASFDTAFWKGKFPTASNGDLICDNYDPGDKVGGHAMTIVGYDDEINAYLVMNSWGSWWGNSGYIWIDYNTFANMTHDAFVSEDIGAAGSWRLHSLENYVHNNKLYYTAVWRKSNKGEIQLYNSTRTQFIDAWNEYYPKGYNIENINCYFINGQERITAVLKKDNVDEYWVIGYAYADYRSKYDDLWASGWRLHDLETYVTPDGIVLYTAFWRKYGGGEYQLYNSTRQQFIDYYNEKVSEGFRLHILNTFQVNGEVRHTSVFKPGTHQEQWVLDYKYSDYRAKYDQLWKEGYRLHHLENYIIDGKLRYSAVFRSSTAAEIQVYGWGYDEYRKYYDAIW